MPHYLYALVPRGAVAPAGRGVEGGEVSVLPVDEQLAVLRSQIEGRRVQPRRSHLTAHDRVLADAMAAGPILPLPFGIITDADPSVIVDQFDGAAARDRMRQLSGRVEVQVLWEPEEDVALRRIAERHPEVADRTVGRVDRGRAIVEALSDLAVEDLTAIVAELADLAVTRDAVEARGTSARVAVLVEADELDPFLDACETLAERGATAGVLRTVGALPPYSFAALDRDPVGV